MRWFWSKPEVQQQETLVIDMMKDDVDPEELTIENAYKTRWILAIGIFFTNMLLLAILLLLAIKL